MKSSTAVYLMLGALGFTAVVLVPTVITRSSTSGLPIWSSLASPGALSSAHAFIGTECESCHTPNQGIKTAACVTCHISDAVTLAKQSTAFHATIGECKGCHIEHQGLDVRLIKMDHSILTEAGVRAGVGPGQTATDAMAAARSFLADATGSKTVTAGQVVPAQPLPSFGTAIQHFLAKATGAGAAMDGQVLDCASCHNVLKAHQGLFGQQCADCHVTETWQIAGFLHPSGKSQECSQCHQAPPSHFMMHFQMVDQAVTGQHGARVEQCYLCHQTDTWNEIKGVGWLKHH